MVTYLRKQLSSVMNGTRTHNRKSQVHLWCDLIGWLRQVCCCVAIATDEDSRHSHLLFTLSVYQYRVQTTTLNGHNNGELFSLFTLSSHHKFQIRSNFLRDTKIHKKRLSSFILVTERRARSWSLCTGSQPAGDFLSHSSSANYFPPARLAFLTKEHHRSSTGSRLYCLVTEAHR